VPLPQPIALPPALDALAAVAAAHPFDRKLLICRRMGVGRELLRSLTTHGVPWINFEVVTPLHVAHGIVAAELQRDGLSLTDEFDELALFDDAIDGVLADGAGRLGELAASAGLREAVAGSVRALRSAGIGAAELAGIRLRDEEKRSQITRILRDYEDRLSAANLIDNPGVFGRALAVLARDGAAALPPGRLCILSGQSTRGLNGDLLRALLDAGAEALRSDPVHGMPRPGSVSGRATDEVEDDVSATPLSWLHDVAGGLDAATHRQAAPAPAPGGDVILDVFAASSVTAELREVLRRVMAAGLHWDEVEIISTDPVAYGVALDGLAQRLEIPVSYTLGLPVSRTRPGRAAASYLDWVQRGCPADLLRQMLDRGDIATAGSSGPALARRLRALRIGRGRDRYMAVLLRALRELEVPQDAGDSRRADEFEADRERKRTELESLSALLRPILDAVPADYDAVSAADLATGLLALLRHTPAHSAVDRAALQRMTQRLERIRAAVTRTTTLRHAVALVLGRLDDRVPAPGASGASPWTAAGGHLHLSDLEHGGYAYRRATFIVGLDAARFPGGGGADALLVDEDRRRLAGNGAVPRLGTAEDRLDERRYAFAALAARLRGRITFSYATWDAVEGRSVAPASELLQTYRLITGDVTADYEALHAATAPAASSVPRGTALIDSADVWLHALAGADADSTAPRALLRGVGAVCTVYPRLEAGVRAWKTRLRSTIPTAYHGFIEPVPGLDPRGDAVHGPRPASPTQLETVGACAHRYMLRYVLRVRPPDDPELSPEQWLPPREKGSLLHAVFERTLRSATESGIAYDAASFEQLALGVLDDEVAALRELLPPPGAAVFERERRQLREDVLAFIAMTRDDAPRVIALERVFGRGGANGEPPVELALPDGSTLPLTGAIDRIDELDDARLVVVDYKTGSSFRYGAGTGVFDGGRRLQHVLYAAAAERLLGRPVARAEYHFPTRRSENHRARYDARALRDGLAIVTDLLELVRRGWFAPTNEPADCRFCDYTAACRVRIDPYGKVTSPLAEWSREADGEAFDLLRRVRR
jgi:hypothetical protein